MTFTKYTIIQYPAEIKYKFLKVNYNCMPDDGRVGRNVLHSILNNWNTGIGIISIYDCYNGMYN